MIQLNIYYCTLSLMLEHALTPVPSRGRCWTSVPHSQRLLSRSRSNTRWENSYSNICLCNAYSWISNCHMVVKKTTNTYQVSTNHTLLLSINEPLWAVAFKSHLPDNLTLLSFHFPIWIAEKMKIKFWFRGASLISQCY